MGYYEIAPGQKILRFPKEIAMLRNGEKPPVLSVEVDLSERCNLSCSHCDFPRHYNADMSIEMAEKITKKLAEWGTQAVTFTGGGEPTINPDASEIVHIFAGGFNIGMYTNGVCMLKEKAAKQLQWVYVSLDAVNAEDYGKRKGKRERWIDAIFSVSYYANLGVTTGAGFLIDNDNYAYAPEMAKLALGLGATYAHFRPVIPCKLKPEANDYLRWAEEAGGHVAWDKFKEARDFKRDYSTCYASMFIRCIDAEGTIWACPTSRWKRKLGHIDTFDDLLKPLDVTADCRTMCRGHAMNKTLDYIMRRGPQDLFV